MNCHASFPGPRGARDELFGCQRDYPHVTAKDGEHVSYVPPGYEVRECPTCSMLAVMPIEQRLPWWPFLLALMVVLSGLWWAWRSGR